jgi:ribonucleoside-diphosphate reductase alpha chain
MSLQVQPSAIVSEDYPFAACRGIYDAAYDMGLKGCTIFRPNRITGSVFTAAEQMSRAPHCCVLEREGD